MVIVKLRQNEDHPEDTLKNDKVGTDLLEVQMLKTDEEKANTEKSTKKISTEGESIKDLEFSRATSEQITKHFENNSEMWAAPLSRLDYLDFQRQMSKAKVNLDCTTYWVICRRDDPHTILSSCSVYLREAIINMGLGSQRVNAAIIADIFTHAAYRMRGMATTLLTKVQQAIKSIAEGSVVFSVIYSNVRLGLYEKLGWQPQRSLQLRMFLGHAHILRPAEDSQLRYLDCQQLRDLCEDDVNMTKLRPSAVHTKDQGSLALILPTEEVLTWHLTRELFLKRKLASSRAKHHHSIHGAFYDKGVNQGKAHAWWVADFRERRLYIARIVTTRYSGLADAIQKILHVAAAEAYALGLRDVVVWEPTTQTAQAGIELAGELGHCVGSIVEERCDTVPCLRMTDETDGSVRMIASQFYGWC